MLRSPSPVLLLTAEKLAVLGSLCLLLPVLLAQHSHFSLHLVSVQLPDCLHSTPSLEILQCLLSSYWYTRVSGCDLFVSLGQPLENQGRRVTAVLAGGVAHKPPPGSTHSIPRYHEK